MLSETRLISEWLALEYPDRPWHMQFRVGMDPPSAGIMVPDENELRLARNLNRRVDAVVEPPPELVMIEAKMFDASTAIGRLLEYRLLLPATPDVKAWGPAPVVMVLLTAQHDPVTEALCGPQGIRYVHFEPTWIGEFYALYPHRRRRAAYSGLTELLGGS